MPRLKHEAETAGSAPVALPASPFASSSTLLDSGGSRRTHRQRQHPAVFHNKSLRGPNAPHFAIRENIGLASGLFIFFVCLCLFSASVFLFMKGG